MGNLASGGQGDNRQFPARVSAIFDQAKSGSAGGSVGMEGNSRKSAPGRFESGPGHR
jgi:hypothetical protein